MADFIDVSKEPNRNSIVWDYFYLNKAKEVAKCMVCAEKNVVKLLMTKKGCTKSLKSHIERVHLEKAAENPSFPIVKKNHFAPRKNLGETLSRMAIDGATFRFIATSTVLRELVGVSLYIMIIFSLGMFWKVFFLICILIAVVISCLIRLLK